MVSSRSVSETEAELTSSLSESENELSEHIPATSGQPGCDCDRCMLGSINTVVYQLLEATILSAAFKRKGQRVLPKAVAARSTGSTMANF